jgi:RNA polymerase sigma-70 factor (ECF subfamily)
VRSPPPAPEDALRTLAQRRALVRALAALAPDDRELLLLRHWDGLAPREIAAALGVSDVAGRARLHRVSRRLQLALDRELGRPGARRRRRMACAASPPCP